VWAASREAPAVPLAGAVSSAGTLDLRAADRDGVGDDATAKFMGGHADERADAYADASPIERLPLGVPQLLVHGEADDVVPPSQSSAYAEAARAAGDDVDLVLRPGEGHFVHTDPSNEAWADVVRWLERFT
jgi:dipeptidyl aminopeptidase/acylaminoacyl peptidase